MRLVGATPASPAPEVPPAPATIPSTNTGGAGVASTVLPVALIAMVGLAKAVLGDTLDPDAFWHFRVADALLRDGIGPLVDDISYASLKTPWTPYSWLAELLMKGLWDVGGFRATMLASGACAALLVVALAISSRLSRPDDRPMPIVIVTVIGALLTFPYVSYRPVTFALVLMGLAVVLLWRDRMRGGRTRAIWGVPLIALVMTNLHIYASLLVMLLVVWTIGVFFDRRDAFVRMIILTVLTGLAACATPMLPGMIQTSLTYANTDPMVASNFITEMRPFYDGASGKVSLALLVALLGLAIARRKRLDVTDWLVLIFATVLLLRLGRFAPVFALMALPIVARVLPAMSDRTLRKPAIRAVFGIVLVIGAVSIVRGLIEPTDFETWLNRHAPQASGYPTRAALWVDERLTPRYGRIINEFNWGGYLAWRLGDRYQVLMDGRTQLYPADFWLDAYFRTPEARRALLARQPADAAILPSSGSQFRATLEADGWRVVHEDALAIVLLPPQATD